MLEQLVVVGEVGGKPVRDREQAFALRRKVGARRVGAADNQGKAIQRRILDVENAHDRIERAAIADVSKLDALDVVGNGASLLGNGQDVVWGDIDEFPERIDEATDQPWARDAVDLGMLSGDPLVQGPAEVAAGRQAPLVPTGEAIRQIACVDAEPSKS